ncbi:MAG: dicarboxylate/amino acid:cation symporter [Pseudomonadales bacterium]|nr:dicarboxylate/amino acid:cation symporter [Pseudomonadales bacterium]
MSEAGTFRKIIDSPLWLQILVALGLAAIVGLVVDVDTTILGASVYGILNYFGTLFVNALKMIVVPLVVATIIVGVANMAKQEAFGRVGGKTVGLYIATGLISVVTGLIFVNLVSPGHTESAQLLVDSVSVSSAQATVLEKVEGRSSMDIFEILLRAVPANILQAALEVQLLALIFVGVVFGFFMSRLQGSAGDTLRVFWDGVHDVMIMITMWIMRFAPIGVFALVGKVLIQSGWEAFQPLVWFFLTVFLALAVHFFVWLPLLLKYAGGIRPYAYYGKVLRAQLTAFSTASSSATLPVTLDSAEKAGISRKVTSFVLPLGATVNMDGTALYECVVVIFIAQLYAYTAGVDFTIGQQLIVVFLALVTSIGVAGVPAASLVAIALILPAVGLPVEWIGIVLVVDRLLDMCRTSVNVTSDLTISALIASSEKEELEDLRAA